MLQDLLDMGQWKASIGSMGLGMIIGKKSDINLLEFYRIGLVRKMWSHTRNLKKKNNTCIYFDTDIYAHVHIINK